MIKSPGERGWLRYWIERQAETTGFSAAGH
jgi:hypothetical protein